MLEFVIGLIVGVIANSIWYSWFKDYSAGLRERISFMKVWEHYHHSTILYILGFRLGLPVLVGVATVFLLDEGIAQEDKFALGSGHFVESLLLELLIIVVWLLAEFVLKLIFPAV